MSIKQSSAVTSDASAGSTQRGWLVVALVCACQFMVILDSSIVNVALPAIQADLGFTPTSLAWVVNGYLLTFAGFMLLSGRAGDLFGPRRMLVLGLLVFSVASLVAGLAPSAAVLVAARVVQGLGAAMMAPATLAVINTVFSEPAARAKAFGAWSAAGGVGGMAGALAGGVLTAGLSWRWIFLINVPIGAILIALALMQLSANRVGRRESIDVLGALTGTAGLSGLVYGVMQIADHGWTSAHVLLPIAVGLALLAAFVAAEARLAKHPMVPLRLFRIRAVATGNLMLAMFGGIAISMWYFSSLFLQNALGLTALEAGLGQTPAAVLFMLVARWASTWLPRAGARRLLLIGSACFFAGFGWLSFADSHTDYLTGVLGPTVIIATGIGLVFPTLMATATADAPESDAGVVGGLATTTNQVGSAVALAALAAAASSRTSAELGSSTPAQAMASGYSAVFLIAAGIGLAIAVVSLLVPSQNHA